MAAWMTIERLAAELVSKGQCPTIEQGIDAVVQAHPDLFALAQREAAAVPPPPALQARVEKTGSSYSLEAVARRLQAEHPGLTDAQAFLWATAERPDLVHKALAEERRQ